VEKLWRKESITSVTGLLSSTTPDVSLTVAERTIIFSQKLVICRLEQSIYVNLPGVLHPSKHAESRQHGALRSGLPKLRWIGKHLALANKTPEEQRAGKAVIGSG
jgi:hypothetical protein